MANIDGWTKIGLRHFCSILVGTTLANRALVDDDLANGDLVNGGVGSNSLVYGPLGSGSLCDTLMVSHSLACDNLVGGNMDDDGQGEVTLNDALGPF